MNRLLVIDGACLFNRFYSKAEPMVIRAEKDIDKKNMLCRQMMKQKNGHYIEVLDGVVSQILRIQNHFLADYLVVVFTKTVRQHSASYIMPDTKENDHQKQRLSKIRSLSLRIFSIISESKHYGPMSMKLMTLPVL